ncbi:hypothetical protein GCM10010359_30580 [Streptomyces morookaense]|nr:hypothetical protein GCM10010359_30580 [Streptomyces morookaense]
MSPSCGGPVLPLLLTRIVEAPTSQCPATGAVPAPPPAPPPGTGGVGRGCEETPDDVLMFSMSEGERDGNEPKGPETEREAGRRTHARVAE